MIFALAAVEALGAEVCTFLVDGAPVDALDCTTGGAWTVSCPLPDGADGKIRVRASAAKMGVGGLAQLPLGARDTVDLVIAGPGGRAGVFAVERTGAGLLAGQFLGPTTWCPVVQPGVAPGSPRAEVPLEVVVTVHRQTGFVDEPLDGGVMNRVPVYDAGTVVARGGVPLRMREVGTVPVLTGRDALPAAASQAVKGQLQLAGPDGTWRTLTFGGSRDVLPVDTGDVTVLVVDFVTPDVATATGADPSAWVEQDLLRWFAGDTSAWLGAAAWGRSGLRRPQGETSAAPATLRAEARGGVAWRIGGDVRSELRVGVSGDRLRAVIAWRAAPFDAAALEAIDARVSVDMRAAR